MFNNTFSQQGNQGLEVWLRDALEGIKQALEAANTNLNVKLFVDPFTGDGSTKKFILTNKLNGNSYNIAVTLNGVDLFPITDYIYSSIDNSVTLTGTAPLAGERIVCKYTIKTSTIGGFYTQPEIGDGATSTYILDHTANGNSEYNISINLNGVDLFPVTDFTFSSVDNSVTILGDASPKGSRILIKYFTLD